MKSDALYSIELIRASALTEAGEKFYLGVKEITEQYENLLKQIENETDKLLRIGIAGDYTAN